MNQKFYNHHILVTFVCTNISDMNQSVRSLQPTAIWNRFADLNAVPRASKKEERVIAFMTKFGKDLGLETSIDHVGNVIIKKPASPGMEDRKTVVMQSHLDMVHQKNSDTNFDFDTQGIEMLVDGDWVRANGTTLGADNGLGVATIMAILESDSIVHPALEALFTIDEETGMTGAMGLQGGILSGDILLNLDTEEDDEIGVGCAGGVDVTATANYAHVNTPENYLGYAIAIKGLQGGHSGMDIHKGLANANKLMNRILYGIQEYLLIDMIDGGSLRNAIPRESTSQFIVKNSDVNNLTKEYNRITKNIKKEFASLEPELSIELLPLEQTPTSVMPKVFQTRLLQAIYTAHNGVYRMSPEITDLVETSNNIARVLVKDGTAHIACLTRSSVESGKWDLANALTASFELMGAKVTYGGDYPGWAPNMQSPILEVMEGLYTKLYGEKPHVAACHAGLECGILGTNYPDMDMISFGPTIKGAHSPDERASISSVQKYWKFVQEILKNIPKKA